MLLNISAECFALSGVSDVVMTNDPMDADETQMWNTGAESGDGFRAALRIDQIVNRRGAVKRVPRAKGEPERAKPQEKGRASQRKFGSIRALTGASRHPLPAVGEGRSRKLLSTLMPVPQLDSICTAASSTRFVLPSSPWNCFKSMMQASSSFRRQ